MNYGTSNFGKKKKVWKGQQSISEAELSPSRVRRGRARDYTCIILVSQSSLNLGYEAERTEPRGKWHRQKSLLNSRDGLLAAKQ